jgi:hypothetical protein
LHARDLARFSEFAGEQGGAVDTYGDLRCEIKGLEAMLDTFGLFWFKRSVECGKGDGAELLSCERQPMTTPYQPVKLVPVDAKTFEAVGYVVPERELYVKFRGSPMLCFADVPNFRYRGLLAAPRKDAYYNTFIKNSFLAKEVQSPVMT